MAQAQKNSFSNDGLVAVLGSRLLRPGVVTALCADEGSLLWSYNGSVAQCWNVETGEEVRRVSFDCAGKLQRCADGVVFVENHKLWWLSSPKKPFFVAPRGARILGLSYNAKRVLLQSGREFFVKEVGRVKRIATLPKHCKAAFLLADGEHLVALMGAHAFDGEVRRVGERGALSKFAAGTGTNVLSLEGTTFLLVRYRTATVWDGSTGKAVASWEFSSSKGPYRTAFDPQARVLLGLDDDHAELRSMEGELLWKAEVAPPYDSNSVLGEGARWFALGDRQKALRVFSAEKQKEILFSEAKEPVVALAWTSDGKRLLAAQGTVVRCWNVANAAVERVWELPSFVRGLAASPDGRMLGVLFSTGKISVFPIETDVELWSAELGIALHEYDWVSMRYTPDGTMLLVWGDFSTGSICFCVDATQQKLLWRIVFASRSYADQHFSLSFSGEKEYLWVANHQQLHRVRLADGVCDQTVQRSDREMMFLSSDEPTRNGMLLVGKGQSRELRRDGFFLERWDGTKTTEEQFFEHSEGPSMVTSKGAQVVLANGWSIRRVWTNARPMSELHYATELGVGCSFAVAPQRDQFAIGVMNGLIAVFPISSP